MGYYPDKFKFAVLCMISKPGKDEKDPYNYRPISLLEIPGKIFEQLLKNRLTKFLEDDNKLNPNKYGFSKK